MLMCKFGWRFAQQRDIMKKNGARYEQKRRLQKSYGIAQSGY